MASPRVMIVEDDPVIKNVEKWRLLNLGYEIAGEAETGEDALSVISKTRPDIVLIDIMLKGEMDGIETARKIKKDYNIPVIFVSAHSDEAIISRIKDVGSEGFIKKPFEDDDLRIAIELGLNKRGN